MPGAAFSTKVMSAAPPATAVTPELIEAAKKEGKVVWYTSVDLPLAEQIAKAFEAKYPGIAVRVERSGAERVFQRIGQEYASNISCGRRRQFLRRGAFHRLEARGHPGALRAGGCRQILPGRAQRPRRHIRQLPRLAVRHRLQHQAGEEGRGAEELRRPARSEMEGQDRQGASGLQRHHHDRDLSDVARPRLGATSRSSRSRTSCRCSPPPIRRRSSRSASAR